MGRADENLRVGAPAFGALDHFLANVSFSSDVDLMVAHALARKEFLCVLAIRAVLHRINIDFGHDRSQLLSKVLYGRSCRLGNPGKNQDIDIWRLPPAAALARSRRQWPRMSERHR